MAKIITYDYNKKDKSLIVTYESGAIRRYPVDCVPQSIQTYIMTDIVNNILDSYKDKYLKKKSEVLPRLEYAYECRQYDSEAAFDYHVACDCLDYISEFSSLSLVNFVNALSSRYIYFINSLCDPHLEDECSDTHYRFFKSIFYFIDELVKYFRIPVYDCSFVFTFRHLLSVAFSISD